LSSALLEVRDVAKRFGGLAAVSGATLEVAEGSITALIGPNGAGKTTLFNLITGVHRPERGEIRFAGARIRPGAPHTRMRHGLVRTFQTARVFPRMTVLENVMVAGGAQPGERVWRLFATPRAVRRGEADLETRARQLLDLVRLDDVRDDYAGTLSGGQRKLLEFARALMCDPTMILLDEPMAGVNPSLSGQLLEHVSRLNAERRLTFLWIDHDLEAVMALSQRVIVMNEGRVIATGAPEEVRRDPGVVDAYLGASHEPPQASS
jgi:neutral amino acid transport system ATP-binding protein